ncbi:MAG TPA: serine hydrolase domain-containing protein [Alphaproteobacteria bacterium]|nr:serine hydrolase domain-containing protein [Alphaproteobacteria bacterium]
MRHFVIGLFAWIALWSNAFAAEPNGPALRGLNPFDREMTELMTRWEIPGGGLAVSYKGRLMLAHGYGLADRDKNEPVTPHTVFRLGSLSKPITAIAALLLAQDGKLDLNAQALPLLGEDGPRAERIVDDRVKTITVRQLLQHRMGLDRDISGDPVFMPGNAAAAKRQGAPMPATCMTLLRDGLERQLDFTPGERYAYSNVGYCMLGLIVARAAGQPYEAFVRERIFAPAQVNGFTLGRTLAKADNEATYYDFPGGPLLNAMPGVASGKVPAPYGAYSLEIMDGYGNWLGSPTEFLRFMLAIDGQRGAALLPDKTREQIFARPDGESKAAYYGLGFLVRPVQGGMNWWHNGSQSGAMAFAVRTAEGYGWTVAVNTRPKEAGKFFDELDRAMWRAAKAVSAWPEGDLFDQIR